MTKQAYLQQDDMFMKLSKARENAQHERNNYNKLGKIEYHVKNLPEIFYSKRRARLSHALDQLCMDLSAARWHIYKAIHGKSDYIACMKQLQQPWQN